MNLVLPVIILNNTIADAEELDSNFDAIANKLNYDLEIKIENISGLFTGEQLENNIISSNKLVNNLITANKIKNNAIIIDKINENVVNQAGYKTGFIYSILTPISLNVDNIVLIINDNNQLSIKEKSLVLDYFNSNIIGSGLITDGLTVKLNLHTNSGLIIDNDNRLKINYAPEFVNLVGVLHIEDNKLCINIEPPFDFDLDGRLILKYDENFFEILDNKLSLKNFSITNNEINIATLLNQSKGLKSVDNKIALNLNTEHFIADNSIDINYALFSNTVNKGLKYENNKIHLSINNDSILQVINNQLSAKQVLGKNIDEAISDNSTALTTVNKNSLIE